MSTDKRAGLPRGDYYIVRLLRVLLEREELARFVIREYLNREDDLGCGEYVWTAACTF